MADRDTKPGPLLRGYEALKAKIGGLAARAGGKIPAGLDWKTAGNEDTPDEVRSQEEMKAVFGGDGAADGETEPKTAVYEDVVSGDTQAAAEADVKAEIDAAEAAERRGEVEIESPDLRAEHRAAPRAADLPDAARAPDSPSLTPLDRRALESLAEDEVGGVPSDGMGLDDAPRDARGEAQR